MHLAILVPQYLLWHYSRALREYVEIWWNILYFVFHFFSIPALLKTLFSPWKRLKEQHRTTLKPDVLLEAFVFSLIMRTVGFLMRSITIILGTLATVAVCVGGIIILLFWLTLPGVVLVLLLISSKLLLA